MFLHTSETSRRPALQLMIAAIVLALYATIPSRAEAQCAGAMFEASYAAVHIWDSSPAGPLRAHIGMSCSSGVPVAPADNCSALAGISVTMAELRAFWPTSTLRIGDTVGGCNFACETGSCFVGSTGLPVELMHFGVE